MSYQLGNVITTYSALIEGVRKSAESGSRAILYVWLIESYRNFITNTLHCGFCFNNWSVIYGESKQKIIED